MSKMPEMRKMEDLLLQSSVEHADVHTAAGEFEEGLATLVAKETKLILEAAARSERLLARLKRKSNGIVEREDVHTAAGAYEE
jgi:hypothetical protein